MTEKRLELLSWAYTLFMLILFVYFYIKEVTHSYQVAFGGALCGLLLVFLLRKTKLKESLPLVFSFLLFLFASQYLGSILGWYSLGWWDTFLHLLSGVLLAFGGLAVLEWIVPTDRLKQLPRLLIFFFVLNFAIFGGVLWEIYEFSGDQLFGMTLQGGGNMDTMIDLISDSFGGLIIALYASLRKTT